MTTMAVQVSWPGVYIEEFAPAAPIQGVSTSTPALIGIASGGKLKTPTLLTSWDAFKNTFGQLPVHGFFLWYAVRGFFENGGQECYVVRASNGAYGTLTVNTRTGGLPLFTVSASQPGAIAIGITIADRHLLDDTHTSLFQPTGALTMAAKIGDKQVVMTGAHAANFRPGDFITVDALRESLQIMRVTMSGGSGTLLLGSPLANAYVVAAAVRLANTPVGATVFRLHSTVAIPAGALVAGAMLTFHQGANTDTEIVASVQTEQLGGGVTYRVTLVHGLGFPVDMTKPASVQSEEFSFAVTQGAGTQVYDGLAVDGSHPRNYVAVINGDPNAVVTIAPQQPPPPIPMPGNMPAQGAGNLVGGAVENLTTLDEHAFLDALDTLHGIADVNMIAVPDVCALPLPGRAGAIAAVQQAVIAHCELLADRFGVLDALPGQDPFDPAQLPAQRAGLDSTRGYAALYYPWLRVPPAGSGDLILVPPSGHTCGIFAQTDNTRGVFKAPANVTVNGAQGLERVLSDIDQGILNLAGINCFRIFQSGGRPYLWAARTTATDRNWQYVNMRRLFIYLEKSIQEGIRSAVFEPNNTQLWNKLKRSIGAFLNQAWRDGALFGDKAEEAYYVRIDDALNPFSEQQLGRLHIEIGVRPSYPAEFIIVRIGIWDGGSSVSERQRG
jgi:phage tail sheath protein FI